MTEELNQVQEEVTTDESDDLFADYDPSLNESQPDDFTDEESQEAIEVPTDNKVEEKTDVQQVASSPEQPTFLEVKYNKEPRSLTKDEAIEFAQKGMNYDNILGKYNAIKEQEGSINELNKLASRTGMSVSELMSYLNNQWNEKELADEVNALKEKYPDSDENLLIEVAQNHIADRGNMLSQKAKEQEEARKSEISRQLDVFQKRYPDIDAQKLDAKVYSLMKDNFTLLEAYESVQAEKRMEEQKQKESQEKIEQLNQENKKRSLGNTTNNGNDEGEDIFISTLFSD